MQRKRAISGGGSIHDGSLRAEKMLNDVSNAALEPFLIKELVTIFASRLYQYLKDQQKEAHTFPL